MNINDFKIHQVDKSFVSPLFESIIKDDLKDVVIKEDAIEIYTFYIEEKDDSLLEGNVCIINPLPKEISFINLNLIMISSENKVIGGEKINLSKLGILPGKSITPIKIDLNKVNFALKDVDLAGCKLLCTSNVNLFNTNKIPNIKIDASFDDTEMKIIESYINNYPSIPPKAFILNVLSPKIKGGELYVPLIIFNNSDRKVNSFEASLGLMDFIGAMKGKKVFVNDHSVIEPKTVYAFKVVFDKADLFTKITNVSGYKAILFKD